MTQELKPHYLREVAYISREWIDAHGLHPAVGVAVEMAADNEASDRSPQDILESPTEEEKRMVEALVRTYIEHGIFPPSPDDAYGFGGWSFSIQVGDERHHIHRT